MGTHPIFESDFDCLTEMTTQEEIETYLKDSLCFTDDVIATCQKLGVTRSFLSLANLDRMAKVISKDETFKTLPVIDGDHLFLPNTSALKKSSHQATWTHSWICAKAG